MKWVIIVIISAATGALMPHLGYGLDTHGFWVALGTTSLISGLIASLL